MQDKSKKASSLKIELDDILGNKKLSRKVDPNAKLSDFADIKINAVHPEIRSEVEKNLKNIRSNVNEMKHLLTSQIIN